MGVKVQWLIKWINIGTIYHHIYRDYRSVWSGYRVVIRMTLDRDRDRIVYAHMTPDQADRLADQLRESARITREENMLSGVPADPDDDDDGSTVLARVARSES